MNSPDRQILRGLFWVALFAIVGRIAGAAKEVVIAWRYGVGPELDGYVFVFNLVTLPSALLFGVFSVVLVPMVAGWPQQWTQGTRRFAGQLLGVVLLVGPLCALLAWFALPALIGIGALRLPPATAAAAQAVVAPLLWALPAGVLVSLGSAWLLAANRHSNTLFEALPALVILLTVALLSSDLSMLAWASVAGIAVQGLAVATSLFFIRRQGAPASTHTPSPTWRAFLGGVGIMVIAQAVMTCTAIVDQFLAARLETGSISALGYATRVCALLLGICAVAIGRATLPVISMARHDPSHMRWLVTRWAWRMLIAGVVLCVLGWLFAKPAVRLLFERGAFEAADTLTVADTLRILLLQLPFYCPVLVLISWASATKRLGVFLLAALCGFAVKIACGVVWTQSYGLAGVAASTVLMYAATAAVMLWGYARPPLAQRTEMPQP